MPQEPYFLKLDNLILNLEQHSMWDIERKGQCLRQVDLLNTELAQKEANYGIANAVPYTILNDKGYDVVWNAQDGNLRAFQKGHCLVCFGEHDHRVHKCTIPERQALIRDLEGRIKEKDTEIANWEKRFGQILDNKVVKSILADHRNDMKVHHLRIKTLQEIE